MEKKPFLFDLNGLTISVTPHNPIHDLHLKTLETLTTNELPLQYISNSLRVNKNPKNGNLARG